MNKTIVQLLVAATLAVPLPVASAGEDTAAAEKNTSLKAAMRAAYDRNADGVIDANERKTLQLDLQRGKIPVPAGTDDREAVKAFRAKVLAVYDADENGRLDQWEMLTLEWDIIEDGKSPAARAGMVLADSDN